MMSCVLYWILLDRVKSLYSFLTLSRVKVYHWKFSEIFGFFETPPRLCEITRRFQTTKAFMLLNLRRSATAFGILKSAVIPLYSSFRFSIRLRADIYVDCYTRYANLSYFRTLEALQTALLGFNLFVSNFLICPSTNTSRGTRNCIDYILIIVTRAKSTRTFLEYLINDNETITALYCYYHTITL